MGDQQNNDGNNGSKLTPELEAEYEFLKQWRDNMESKRDILLKQATAYLLPGSHPWPDPSPSSGKAKGGFEKPAKGTSARLYIDAEREEEDTLGPDGRKVFDGIHPEIEEFCEHFNIDERAKTRFNTCMTSRREETWADDMARLYEDCEHALQKKSNPTALLMKKVSDMYKGTFVGKKPVKDKEVREFAAKYKIDAEARHRLEEALTFKEPEEKTALLSEMAPHLDASNSTSKCVMRMLSFIMKNQPMPLAPKKGDKGKGKGKKDDNRRDDRDWDRRDGWRNDSWRDRRDDRRGDDSNRNDDRGGRSDGKDDKGGRDRRRDDGGRRGRSRSRSRTPETRRSPSVHR